MLTLPPSVRVFVCLKPADSGIIHRDIKPLNIIIGNDGRPKLIDFGICSSLHERTIGDGGIIGTPAYMSPEQAAGVRPLDLRSDIFSLGLVAYYLIVGQPAVQAGDSETAKRMIREQNIPALRQLDPSVPAHLDATCTRMLAKRREHRFQSAADICQALNNPGACPGDGFCPACGITTQGTSKFCPSCGAPLSVSQPMVLCLACGQPADSAPECPSCHRPFSPSNHRLQFISGSSTGRIFRVPEGLFDVGRDVIAPRDFAISHRHFRVACSNGSVHVEDAGSTNKKGSPPKKLLT